MKMPKFKMPQVKMSKTRIKSIDAPKGWLFKTIVFGALLSTAGALFGLVLQWCGDGYTHLIPGLWDFGDTLRLGLWAVGAIAVVAVTAGFVAILVRPFWVAALEMLASALVLFLCWHISLAGFVVALIYFLAGLIYIAGVRAEIAHRIKFSVWNIRGSQAVLLVILVALACTSLYFGYAEEINKEGFALPDEGVQWTVDFADKYIVDKVMPEGTTTYDRKQVLEKLQDYLANDLQEDTAPYEDYIPMGLAAIAFSVLMLAVFILSWVPLLVLSLTFLILLRLKVIKKKAHPVEVTRLSIE